MKCLDVEPELPAEVDKGNQEGLMISCFIHLTPLVRVCKKLEETWFYNEKGMFAVEGKVEEKEKSFMVFCLIIRDFLPFTFHSLSSFH